MNFDDFQQICLFQSFSLQYQGKMINVDFSDLSIYRSDGRKNNELRQSYIEIGIDSTADGSCLFKQGLTEVICLVYGPYQRPNYNENLLKIQYTVAPFSSLEKRKGKYDKEFSQFTENIRKSFEAVIIQDLYKKNQIEIIVSVIKNEGSAKSAVMNSITIALTNAGICMRDLIISCTAATYNGNVLIDTNEEEEYDANNQLIISYLNKLQTVDCLELKKAKIREEELRNIHQMAIQGCQELYKRVRKVLLDYSYKKMLIF